MMSCFFSLFVFKNSFFFLSYFLSIVFVLFLFFICFFFLSDHYIYVNVTVYIFKPGHSILRPLDKSA